VVNAAVPFVARTIVPREIAPSRNVTDPVIPEPSLTTLAVRVIGCPAVSGLPLEPRSVAVGACRTVTATPDEVADELSASPLYTTNRLWDPRASELVLKLKLPVEETGCEAITIEASRSDNVPVGVMPGLAR
jgi:hypothetical protein